MTKADFRATRETIGLTQGDVAEACGVSLRTVKRWEHPDWPEPPFRLLPVRRYSSSSGYCLRRYRTLCIPN